MIKKIIRNIKIKIIMIEFYYYTRIHIKLKLYKFRKLSFVYPALLIASMASFAVALAIKRKVWLGD
jgi:hypothetical protein